MGKVAAFGLEFGPFEVPLPGRLVPALALVLLLIAGVAAGLYLVVLRPPLEGARAALRLARYDTALAALEPVPAWLAYWPGLAALRDKARLGRDLNTPPQDNGLALTNPADKRCYARLGQAVSRRLAAPSGRSWSLPQCDGPPPGAPAAGGPRPGGGGPVPLRRSPSAGPAGPRRRHPARPGPPGRLSLSARPAQALAVPATAAPRRTAPHPDCLRERKTGSLR